MTKPKIYLAGKIAKNDWRQDVVPWEESASGPRVYTRNDERLGVNFQSTADDFSSFPARWALRIGNRYDVTGPFFIRCDHGCTHGNSTHATAGGCCEVDAHQARNRVRQLCLDAIDRSDIVLAWLDRYDHDAYGTLTELGYALGKGKHVIVATPKCDLSSDPSYCYACGHCGLGPNGECTDQHPVNTCDCPQHGETWFAVGMGQIVYAHSPIEALQHVVNCWYTSKIEFDSEVERQFWATHINLGSPIADLEAQWTIDLGSATYRLDFFSPSTNCAIEVDGLTYHNGQDSFIRDRNRQRDLEKVGIRFLRFAAKEIMNDPERCVREAAEWAASA